MSTREWNYHDEVMRNCPNFATDSIREKLSLGGLGVAGEAGEVADLIKKVLHHEVPLTDEMREKIVREMGDVHWYLEYLAAALGFTTEHVLIRNIEKLRARHPKGWSPASQRAKADEDAPNRPAKGEAE